MWRPWRKRQRGSIVTCRSTSVNQMARYGARLSAQGTDEYFTDRLDLLPLQWYAVCADFVRQ